MMSQSSKGGQYMASGSPSHGDSWDIPILKALFYDFVIEVDSYVCSFDVLELVQIHMLIAVVGQW